MPISNWWNHIITWFQDRNERNTLVRDFNRAARESFVSGNVPVIIEASISRGNPAYHHQFSKRIGGSGFRIKAMSGYQLSREATVSIGKTILDNNSLVRKLVVLGWDTIEVHSDVGSHGCQWQLKAYIELQR